MQNEELLGNRQQSRTVERHWCRMISKFYVCLQFDMNYDEVK